MHKISLILSKNKKYKNHPKPTIARAMTTAETVSEEALRTCIAMVQNLSIQL